MLSSSKYLRGPCVSVETVLPATEAPARAKRRLLVAGALVAALALGAGGFAWARGQARYVSTNDAQVKGDILALSPKIGGRIAAVHGDMGARVEAGQLLAELDASDIRIQLRQAEANLAAARATFASSETGVSLQSEQTEAQRAQARAASDAAGRGLQAAEAARAKAAADFARASALFAEGGVSRQQLDAARLALETASAQRDAAASQLRGARAAVALADSGRTQVRMREQAASAARAQLAQAEASVAAARQQLENTRLLAPTSGTVARLNLHPGEMIQPGQPLMSVVSERNLRVEAFLEETKIRRVRVGAPVRLDVDAYAGTAFVGRVADLGAAAGSEFALIPANNGSGNFTKVVQRLPIRIAVEDPAHALKPGMSVSVRIDVEAGR